MPVPRELGFAARGLIAGAQQKRNDDEARQQRGATLAHEGQGDAGKGDEAGDAADDEERLEGDCRGKAAGAKCGEVGLGAGGGGEAAHGEQHEQEQYRGAAQKAHLLTDGGEDEVGLDDGDQRGHALANTRAHQAAICQGEQRLHQLVAISGRVGERVEPDLETGLHVAHDLVRPKTAHGQQRKADDDVGDAARSNVEHQQEDGVEQHGAAQVAFKGNDEHADAPDHKERQQQHEAGDLKAQYLVVGDGEKLAVLGQITC